MDSIGFIIVGQFYIYKKKVTFSTDQYTYSIFFTAAFVVLVACLLT